MNQRFPFGVQSVAVVVAVKEILNSRSDDILSVNLTCPVNLFDSLDVLFFQEEQFAVLSGDDTLGLSAASLVLLCHRYCYFCNRTYGGNNGWGLLIQIACLGLNLMLDVIQ